MLTVDEVITPQIGNCTIFARYVEAGFATQVVLNARLTRFYEREDWKRRLKSGVDVEPLLLERGIAMDVRLLTPPSEPRDKLREAAQAAMDNVTEQAEDVQFTNMDVMRQTHEQRKQKIEV